ncbi:Uncharacterised protein [Bordetella pertussis]|nr:Uncharacterised protein [Bordetella pertussis]
MAAVAAALARAVRVRARMVDLRVLPFLADLQAADLALVLHGSALAACAA